jgi:hypothetical protein
MNDYRIEMRHDLDLVRKSIAELGRASGIAYKRLSGFFCQYWYLSQEEERRVRGILLLWKDKKPLQTQGTFKNQNG